VPRRHALPVLHGVAVPVETAPVASPLELGGVEVDVVGGQPGGQRGVARVGEDGAVLDLTQGVDPRLDLSRIDEAKAIVEACNELPVHERHPYAGELVYTAFSGSHQDAIKKGMYAQQRSESDLWDVPYLALDPMDVGRTYEAIIRVNSQSGKGGVAYVMETEHHLELPRGLQDDFAQKVQAITDARGDELTADELLAAFHDHYLAATRPFELISYTHWSGEDDRIAAKITVSDELQEIEGSGNGPIAALVEAFERQFGVVIKIREYHEHAMSASADATAAAYVEADVDEDAVWGVGLHPSIVTASLRAIINAVNRQIALRQALAAAAKFDEG